MSVYPQRFLYEYKYLPSEEKSNEYIIKTSTNNKETKMAKTNTAGLNQHKALAMGKSVTGMKKGGAVKADKAADKSVKTSTKAPVKKTVK